MGPGGRGEQHLRCGSRAGDTLPARRRPPPGYAGAKDRPVAAVRCERALRVSEPLVYPFAVASLWEGVPDYEPETRMLRLRLGHGPSIVTPAALCGRCHRQNAPP